MQSRKDKVKKEILRDKEGTIRTVLKDIPQQVKDFLEIEPGIHKNLIFKTFEQRHFATSNILVDGKDIYYNYTDCNIAATLNGRYYIIKGSKKGLSFKDGKLQLWYGGNISNFQTCITEIILHMKWNFIESFAINYITKSILEKIFQGKVTCTRDIFRLYLKSVRFKASTEFMYQAVKMHNLSKIEFYRLACSAKSIDHLLLAFIQNRAIKNNQIINDFIEQTRLLNSKIDYYWSDKRILAEHELATKEIMKYEMDLLEDYKVEYPFNIEYPNLSNQYDDKMPIQKYSGEKDCSFEIELLDTMKRVFEEGTMMKHCIYTNFWHTIKNLNYIAFNIRYNGKIATLGCYINYIRYETRDDIEGLMEFKVDKSMSTHAKLEINQLYSIGNQPPGSDIERFCNDWIKNMKPIQLSKSLKIEPFVPEIDPIFDAQFQEV